MEAVFRKDCGLELESVDTAHSPDFWGPEAWRPKAASREASNRSPPSLVGEMPQILSPSTHEDNPAQLRIILPKNENVADRFESMSILVAVVEAGSFSAAARQLKIPLATVSRKVADLESHLKTRLLHRSTRRLSLTEAGQSYVAACRRILEEMGEAERAAPGEYAAPKGELVITAPIVFGRQHVLPVVADFLKTYPDIDVRMTLTDRKMDLLDRGSHRRSCARFLILPGRG